MATATTYDPNFSYSLIGSAAPLNSIQYLVNNQNAIRQALGGNYVNARIAKSGTASYSPETLNSLKSQLSQMGVQGADQVAKTLAGYGVTDLSKLQSVPNPLSKGHNLFYNPANNTFIPETVGTANSKNYSSLSALNGKIGVNQSKKSSSLSDFGEFAAGAAALFGGAALGAGALGAGAAAGEGAGAGAATGAGAAAGEGATGLASLPAAGTWAQTAAPALGAGAGEWTLPASLSGISGATATGGLTLGDALANANAAGGATPAATSGGNILNTAEKAPTSVPGGGGSGGSPTSSAVPTSTSSSFNNTMDKLYQQFQSLGGESKLGSFADYATKFLTSGGGALLAGLVQGYSANKAANTQADAAKAATAAQVAGNNAAIAEQQREFNTIQANEAPWLKTGGNALNALSYASGLPSTMNPELAASGIKSGQLVQPFDQTKFQADPGYQFLLSEGQKALANRQAASGMYLSGNALKDLDKYTTGLADTTYNEAFSRYNTERGNLENLLLSEAGLGQTATGQVNQAATNTSTNVSNLLANSGQVAGSNILGGANASAAGTVGTANAIVGGINNGVNQYLNYQAAQNALTPSSMSSWGNTGSYAW